VTHIKLKLFIALGKLKIDPNSGTTNDASARSGIAHIALQLGLTV
jgi:hypothetical protein